MGRHRDAADGFAPELRIGEDGADRRVARRGRGHRRRRAREPFAALAVPDVAERVDDHDRGHGRRAGAHRRDAQPTGGAATLQLRDGPAGPGADEALRRIVRRHPARGVARARVGPDVPVAGHEVEDHGTGHMRDPPVTDRDADAALLEESHHAGVRGEPKCAAAREQHGVEDRGRRPRTDDVGLDGGGCAAAHVHPRDGCPFAEDDRAAGQRDGIGPMPDGEAGRQRHVRAESATILRWRPAASSTFGRPRPRPAAR